MRNFKIFLWIFIIFLIQTVILARIHVFGAAPSIVLSYAVCIAVLENEFNSAAVISIICAAAMGALGGRSFILTTLFYTYSSIIIFAARKKPAYMNNAVKALFWTFVASALSEIMFFSADAFTLTYDMLITNALPTAVINTALTAVVYPILNASMYREKKRKLLIT